MKLICVKNSSITSAQVSKAPKKKAKKPLTEKESKSVAKTHLKTACKTPGAKPDGTGQDGVFKDYDLKALGVPKQAWPDTTKENKGKHGYTVRSEYTGAVTHRNLSVFCFPGTKEIRVSQSCEFQIQVNPK